MGIQIYRDITIDFSNGRYIIINAKQHDSKSRFLRMTCTNVGQTVNLNPTDYSAFIRYRKSDGYGAFNKCIISTDGKIIFELTEQMLSTVGTSYADLLIMDVAKSDINNDLTIISADGKIIENNASIASTMTFYINVLEKPLNDWDIESTNEFSALNDLLLKATKDYEYIVQTTKEYMDNAKGSENAASQSAKNAKKSEDNAKKSEINTANNERKSYHQAVAAFNSALLSKSYAIGESGYLTNESWETILTSSSDYVPIEARQYEDVENAKYYYLQSAILARQAKDSALSAEKANQELINLKLDVSTIKKSEENAKQSELNAKKSEDNAKDSEKKSDINALISQSYAVGNASDWLTDNQGNQIITSDGVALYLSFAREDENTDNAKYYKEKAEQAALDSKKKADAAKESATQTEKAQQETTHLAKEAKDSERKASISVLEAMSYANGTGSDILCTSENDSIISSDGTIIYLSYCRENEKTANAKYYCEQAALSFKDSSEKAKQANESANAAKQSELNAKKSEINSKDSEKKSDMNSLISQSYAIGNASDWLTDQQGNQIITSDGVALYLSFAREDENTDNAKYYYEQIKAMLDPLQNIILSLTNRITALEEIIETSDLDIVTKFLDHQGNSFITKENEVLRMDTNMV